MNSGDIIKVAEVSTSVQIEEVRKLVRSFVSWHRARHTEDKELIDAYFDESAIETELQSLPGKYVNPDGTLLIAYFDDQPAGCVALRRLDDSSCEMKRMFVYEKFHGKGIGSALAKAIIQEAKILGYSTMKLDTSFRQKEAQQLYERFGFRKTENYYPLPDPLKNWLVFMELDL